jgi:hypothetical protein
VAKGGARFALEAENAIVWISGLSYSMQYVLTKVSFLPERITTKRSNDRAATHLETITIT